MSILARPKLIVTSEQGWAPIAPFAEHFHDSNGFHVGGEVVATKIDTLVAQVDAMNGQVAALRATLPPAPILPGALVAQQATDSPAIVALLAKIAAANTKIAAHCQAAASLKWVGVVYHRTIACLDTLAAIPGVHVTSERDPDPVSPAHLAQLAHVPGLLATDTGYSLARKLHVHYKSPIFRPD